MATSKLAEFKKLKAEVQKEASATIANNLAQVEKLLQEVKELSEATGIIVDVRSLSSEVENIAELHPDWNSSSYDC